MNRKKSLVGLLSVLLLLIALPAASESGIVTGTTISGTVRVYLSSIGSLNAVDLSLDGSYSIGGDASRAIARGAHVHVANSGGTLRLSIDGQTQTMGSRFKLRRHQTSGENGVRIAQARFPDNLYPGDMEFIANGGNVQIIAHVFMEDYMLGVLPYEMDNSFPLEALKAQAVAARTYALKRMSAQASTYDVVDTTGDQVYNGTPQGNARCRQAIEETANIIGTVNGDYMASYYTASNGGQTESVANAWGSGSYAYLQVKDDPFDLRNTASVAKSVTFYQNGTTSVAALTQLLCTEAAAIVGASSVKIEQITAVTPHTPRYAWPSRVYSKVDVSLRLEYYGDVTVTLDYFSQIEGLCGLSINAMQNETLSVSEIVGGYRLTARRYGHGIGMSQRGAQQMASEGMTYDQILEFYYPGLTRTRYTMTRTLLPAMDGTTQMPGEPTGDARIAIVTLSNPLDSLNLRKEPNTSSAVLARIAHGTQVMLLEMGSAWSLVQHGTLSGYVSNDYLSVPEDDPSALNPPESGDAPETWKGTATVVLQDETQVLNLRAAPTTGSAVLAKLRHGQTLFALERYETWTCVRYGTLIGYVMNSYIRFDSAFVPATTEAPQATPSPQQGASTATVHLQSADSMLNLRAERNLRAAVLARIPNGTRVTLSQWGEEWCLVVYNGTTGYCSTDYLRFDSEPEPTSGEEPAKEYVAIVLPSAGLNLRAAASRTSGVIMTLPQGTMLSVLGADTDDFLPVALGSLRGYVAGEYVYVTDEAVIAQPTPANIATPTPGRTVTPVPAPTATPFAHRSARVTASIGLYLRSSPTTSSMTLATMPYGAMVLVTGEETNGFYPVMYGELEGYASARYLSIDARTDELNAEPDVTYVPSDVSAVPELAPSPEVLPTPVPPPSGPISGRHATVIASSGLNLRSEPSGGASVLATLAYGASVIVIGDEINGFYPVRIGTLSGYVSAAYLRFGDVGTPTSTPASTPQSPRRALVVSGNGLNLRAAPNRSAEVLYVLPYGMVLEVLDEADGGFLHVRWNEYTGYVSDEYVEYLGNE